MLSRIAFRRLANYKKRNLAIVTPIFVLSFLMVFMNAFLASSENLRKDDALSRYGGWKYATMDKDSEYLNGRIGLTYYLAQIEVEGVIVEIGRASCRERV